MPVRPRPLDVAAVADLVRHRLGEPADDTFVAACHRTTSGNPLLLRQLLRALQSDRVKPDASHADTVTAIGSRAVSSMILMRLSKLPRDCTPVARAVSVLGDAAELPAVAALAGPPESEVAPAVALLAHAEVLRDEYPLGFVHPVVRDAVYRDVPPGEREMAHQRAAQVLEAARAAREQVAAHLLLVPRRGDPWTVEVLRAAAATAAKRGGQEGAVSYLTRALAEPPTPQVGDGARLFAEADAKVRCAPPTSRSACGGRRRSAPPMHRRSSSGCCSTRATSRGRAPSSTASDSSASRRAPRRHGM